MSLGVLNLLSKLSLLSERIYIPRRTGSTFWFPLLWLWHTVSQGVCIWFYGAVKWLLALVDFMQYFVQKLIGLDYWLNRSNYTLEGAIKSDLVFGFVYNDTVQNVFRAMVGVFFVLLIIFTIYAIIKSEWEHITGGSNGGKFGDGTSNSKTKIFRNSLKAIALVLIFPIFLSIGIVSANAILASLIKALNIDTSSTLGGQLFQIGSQTANKYEKYANSGARAGVSDYVTFYMYEDAQGKKRHVTLGNGSANPDLVYNCDTYEEYLNIISKSEKYTVDSIFRKLDLGDWSGHGLPDGKFQGFLADLNNSSDNPYFIMVYTENTDDDKGHNGKYAYEYYLKNVLQVTVITTENIGHGGFSQIGAGDDLLNPGVDGYIQATKVNSFNNVRGRDIPGACKNTWYYADIYAKTTPFENALNYTVVRPGESQKVKVSKTTGQIGYDSANPADYEERELLDALGLGGITNAKVMFNTEPTSLYMDGGQLGGLVQMQAEYMVMSEVINFISENNFKLHIMDITSDLIDWKGQGDYVVEDRWIALNGNKPKYVEIADGMVISTDNSNNRIETNVSKKVLPFVVSYSDICNDTEMSNVLYTAGVEGNELKGSKYIMCIQVNGGENAKYIPVINNRTYTDPTTGRMYNFKSSYYSSNYHGVVVAKAPMCNVFTNNYLGEPTYFKSGTDTSVSGAAYYYDLSVIGQFNQYGENVGYHLSTDATEAHTVSSVMVDLPITTELYYQVDLTKDNKTTHEYNISKISTDQNIPEEERRQIVVPNVDMIEHLRITLQNGTGESAKYNVAKYTGKNIENNYMFSYLDGSRDWYFFVEVDGTNKSFKIKTCEEITGTEADGLQDYQKYKWNVLNQRVDPDDENSAVAALVAQTHLYWIYYDYTSSDPAKDRVGAKVVDKEVSPHYFEYSKITQKEIILAGSSEPTLVKQAIYTTKDMQQIESLSKPVYINITFNTQDESLIKIVGNKDNPHIQFAKIRETIFDGLDPTNTANLAERANDKFLQRSQNLRFYLYDFYSASIGTGTRGDLFRYNDGSIDPTPLSSTYFDIKIDSNDFKFVAQDSYLHLYDGSSYVATIYKTTSDDPDDAITDISQLSFKTTKVLKEYKEYLNIQTQNRYKVTTQDAADTLNNASGGSTVIDQREIMEVYYKNVKASMAIDCVRDNRGYTFLEMDVKTEWFVKWRWEWGAFTTNMNSNQRKDVMHTFKLIDGIQFDYFFEDSLSGGIGLGTFYIASEISYWILIIASILMIKVLGVAIWGVIKRIYEITLYFIAAPAVASTIPLDNGNKFKSSITDPLIQKVLATYGTMLGINIFFILLYPVKSLSKIFTIEDIRTTDSYFMKHFLSWISDDVFRVGVLNLYVYILFVLVAFTMIDSLPEIMSKMLGTQDIKAMGKETKEKSEESMKTATEFMSGKNLADKVGEITGGIMESAPVRLGKWIHDKVKKNADDEEASDEEDSTETPKEKPKSREEEEEDELNTEIDEEAKKRFEAQNGMSYEDYVAQHGQEAADEKLDESRQEVENEIAAGTNPEDQNKRDTLQRIQQKREESKEEVEDDTPKDPEEVAEQEFGGDMETMAEQLTGDKANAGVMQANAARQAVAAGGEVGQKVTKAVMAGKTKEQVTAQVFGDSPEGKKRKEQAVLASLSTKDKEKYMAMKPEDREKFLEQFDVSAEVDDKGNVKVAVGKKGDKPEDFKAIEDQSVANDLLASSMSNEQINDALDPEKNPENAAAATEAASAVASFASQNIAAAINFGDAANDPLANQIVESVFRDPKKKENGEIMDQAIFDYLNAAGNEDVLKAFQKHFGLSDKQIKDPTQMMKAISELRANSGDGMSIDLGNGVKIGKEAYSPFMAGAVQQAVQTGAFSVSAWDLFNQVDPTQAQEYVDRVAAENLMKTEDDVAYEQQQSQELAKNMDLEAFMRVLAGQTDGKYEQIAQIFDQFLNISEQDKANALKNIDPTKLNALRETLSDDEIARAQILVEKGVVNNIDEAAKMMQEGGDQDALAKIMMDHMIGNKDQNLEVLQNAFGFGKKPSEIFNQDELDSVRASYAENGVAALDLDSKKKLQDRLAAEMFGGKKYSELGKEEREKVKTAMAGMSAYEVNQMMNATGEDGKPLTRAEILEQTKKKARHERSVREAMETEDLPADMLLAAVDGDDQEAVVRIASQTMDILDPEEKKRIEAQAQEDALYKGLFEGKTKAEMLAEYKKQGKTEKQLEADMLAKLTGKSSADAESEIDAEVFAQSKARMLELYGGSEKYEELKAKWLKKPGNSGKSEDVFIRELLENDSMLQALDPENGHIISDVRGMQADFRAKKIRSLAVENIDGYEADVMMETRKREADATLVALANGYGDYASQVGAELAENDSVMALARARFSEMHQGRQLDEASEEERNMFLFANYQDKLDPKRLKQIKEKTVGKTDKYTAEDFADEKKREEIVSAAFKSVTGTPEKFKAVYDFMSSYDGGEEGNELALKIKRKAFDTNVSYYEESGVKVAHAIDPDKLGAEERKRFEHRQNVLQSEMRSNPEVIANLFKNNTILEQDGVIAAILQAQGSTMVRNEDGSYTVTDNEGNETKYKNADELKQSLSTESINNYMNSHESIKDKLVNIGAQNITTALDTETQEAKKVDAVLTSPYLRNQVTTQVLQDAGLDPTKDKELIKQLIEQMLKAEGRENEKVTDANFGDYMAELALYGITGKGKDAKAGVYNATTGKYERDVTQFTEKVKELEGDGTNAFATNLRREVTKIIDPANYDPNISSQQFFATRSLDEFRASDVDVHSMADAINKFNNKGFLWFGRGKTKMVDPNASQQPESKLPDKKKHKVNKDNLYLYEQSKDELEKDEEFKKYKESLGDKAKGMSEYELMMNFFDSNKKSKEKYQGRADAKAFREFAKSSGMTAEDIKKKYGVAYSDELSDDELAEALKSGNRQAKTIVQNKHKKAKEGIDVSKAIKGDSKFKRDLVDDVDLSRSDYVKNFDLKEDDMLDFAMQDPAIIAALGDRAKDKDAVKAFLNDDKNKKLKEKLTTKAKVAKIKESDKDYDAAVDEILKKQGKVDEKGNLTEKGVSEVTSGRRRYKKMDDHSGLVTTGIKNEKSAYKIDKKRKSVENIEIFKAFEEDEEAVKAYRKKYNLDENDPLDYQKVIDFLAEGNDIESHNRRKRIMDKAHDALEKSGVDKKKFKSTKTEDVAKAISGSKTLSRKAYESVLTDDDIIATDNFKTVEKTVTTDELNAAAYKDKELLARLGITPDKNGNIDNASKKRIDAYLKSSDGEDIEKRLRQNIAIRKVRTSDEYHGVLEEAFNKKTSFDPTKIKITNGDYEEYVRNHDSEFNTEENDELFATISEYLKKDNTGLGSKIVEMGFSDSVEGVKAYFNAEGVSDKEKEKLRIAAQASAIRRGISTVATEGDVRRETAARLSTEKGNKLLMSVYSGDTSEVKRVRRTRSDTAEKAVKAAGELRKKEKTKRDNFSIDPNAITVENLEIFKEFEADEEAVAAYRKKYNLGEKDPLDYQKVMEFLADDGETEEEAEVAHERRKKYKEKIAQETVTKNKGLNAQFELQKTFNKDLTYTEFLKKNAFGKAYYNRTLGSTKSESLNKAASGISDSSTKSVIAKRIERQSITDADIDAYLQTDEAKNDDHLTVKERDLILAAKSDAKIREKLGDAADNDEVVRVYLNSAEGRNDRARIRKGIQVSRIKKSDAYRDKVFETKLKKAAGQIQVSDDEADPTKHPELYENAGLMAVYQEIAEGKKGLAANDDIAALFRGYIKQLGGKGGFNEGIKRIKKDPTFGTFIGKNGDVNVNGILAYIENNKNSTDQAKKAKAEELENALKVQWAIQNRTKQAKQAIAVQRAREQIVDDPEKSLDPKTPFLSGIFTAIGKKPKTATPSQTPQQGPRKNPLIVGQTGVVFAVTEKVTKESKKYDNWNRIIQHKITQIKQDTTLTRAQKEVEIRKLQSQIIYKTRPDSYKNMTADEQNAFDAEQEKLKRMALKDKSLANYIRVLDRVRRGEISEKDIPKALRGELTDAKPTRDSKQKHLEDFQKMQDIARRFQATAAMRNMERDYGDEFEEFAKKFLTKQQFDAMMKNRAYKIVNSLRYKDMSIREREAQRRLREQALASEIARLNRDFARKVAKDKAFDRKTTKSFLEARDVDTQLLRYRNGMTKFAENKVHVPHITETAVRDALKVSETVQIQQRAAGVDEMMREFVKFNSTFKGTSEEYARQLRALAKKMGVENEKMIENIYKKAGKFLGFMGKSIEHSTVSVQQRKVMEGLNEELRKCQERLVSKGKIAASKELAHLFVGKTYSGSTTQMEVELHKQNAEELSRLVKLIKDQRGLVSYESLAKRVSSTFMADFLGSKEGKGISGKSEEAKKNALEAYFKKRLDDALKLMHNDGYQMSDKKKLMSLTGRLINKNERRYNKSEIDESGRSKVLSEAMKTADNPIYQAHVRNVNATAESVRVAKLDLDRLTEDLRIIKDKPRTAKTINQISNIEKAIRDAKVKLNTLKGVYNTAVARKTSYEQAFASTQIKEAKAVTRARAINSASASVLDRYSFYKTDGSVVSSDSVDGKQVQMLVSEYIQKYRQSIERMLKDEVIKNNEELHKYIDGMESKFTADFGRNMKYTKQVRDELQRYVDEIDKKGKTGDQVLKAQLMDYIRALSTAEKSLGAKMTGMKIDISRIALKK